MEESIKKMSNKLANFCNYLDSTSVAFSRSLDRRPIPLDSASTTFVESLNGRISSLSGDLNLLESMSLATVSFEELLGHCNQLYKLNHSHLLHLHSHLVSNSFLPPGDGVDHLQEDFMADVVCLSPQHNSTFSYSHNAYVDDDDHHSLFGDSPNLCKLGLSDISLATLASGGAHKHDVLHSPPRAKVQNQDPHAILHTVDEEEIDEPKLSKASKMICVSEDDYENLAPYLKIVASWKDLLSAVEKMNSFLLKKGNTNQKTCFHSEELDSMDLGDKGRAYVLLLVRMKRLSVETTNGLISYRVL